MAALAHALEKIKTTRQQEDHCLGRRSPPVENTPILYDIESYIPIRRSLQKWRGFILDTIHFEDTLVPSSICE